MRILIDVDEVLSDFVGYYESLIVEVTNEKPKLIKPTWNLTESYKLSEENKTIIRELMNSRRVAWELEPFPYAVDTVLKLNEKHDVWFVTAPLITNKTWCYDRIEWFKKHFGGNFHEKLIFASQKQLICGDIFIDDKITNLEDWKNVQANGLPILWERDYNKGYKNPKIKHASDWGEVINYIKELEAR